MNQQSANMVLQDNMSYKIYCTTYFMYQVRLIWLMVLITWF